jgi:hypothetical protein
MRRAIRRKTLLLNGKNERIDPSKKSLSLLSDKFANPETSLSPFPGIELSRWNPTERGFPSSKATANNKVDQVVDAK